MPTALSDGRFPPATLVAARGELWVVESSRAYEDCATVALSPRSPSSRARRTLLRPFDRIVAIPPSMPRFVGRRAWARQALSCAAGAVPFGSVEAAAAAQIDLLPYQLEPAIAMLRFGATRLLIADEVGLGKTIQAALLLAELARTAHALRAVVLAPASLVEQWRRELHGRFGLSVVVVDACGLAERVRSLPPDVNPWCLPGVYLASIDFAKQPEVLRSLEQAIWDLVIVDEAHNAGAGTHRRAAANAVCTRARRVVLLTATPPEGDSREMAALLELGRVGDPVVLFRRTRADAGIVSRRRTTALHVRLSAAERRMHGALEAYATRLWREGARGGGPEARLLASLLRKRALSSATALAVSVRRRMELLHNAPVASERQMLLPLEEGATDAPDDVVLAARGLEDPAEERMLLARLQRLADAAARRESKVAVLCRFVRRARQPLIVFTEYRDTLLQLEAVLRSSGASPRLLHGGMTAAERDESCRAFNEHGAVLLATDAAAEGLNLHHRCRTVVHFELPWTPARLEQRTGRVDRLGQHARVHELLLVARHTAERLVLLPLLRRARAAAAGAQREDGRLARLTDIMVASAVMSGDPPPLNVHSQDASLQPVRFASAAAAEADRLRRQRRIARAVAPTLDSGGMFLSTIRRGPLTSATLLFEAALADTDGRAMHADLIALRVRISERAERELYENRRLRHFVRDVIAGNAAHLERLVLQHAEPSFAAASAQFEAAEHSLARRDAQIGVSMSTARTLAQAGLFDRREIVSHLRRRRAQELLIEEAGIRTVSQRQRLVARVTLKGCRFAGRR